MRRSPVDFAAALVFALILNALAFDRWLYLIQGYDIGVFIEGGRGGGSYKHIEFPVWRRVAHLVQWAAALGALGLLVAQRRHAAALAWAAFAAISGVGVYDVYQYGALGAPTSIWIVVLILLLSLAASRRRQVNTGVNP